MAHKRTDRGLLEDDTALTALISTVRQEIVDTIESIGGDAAIAVIGAQLGRPAAPAPAVFSQRGARGDEGGVRGEGADPGDGRGRRYRTAAQRGKRVRLK